MKRFEGKVAIITGAGTGIGAATARRLFEEGASVVLAGRRREKLEEVAATLEPARVLVHPTDVAVRAEVDSLVAATVARFGRLDVLINNAGAGSFGPFDAATDEEWRRIMAINLDGVFFGCQTALPHLLESRGNIVNVSSVSGLGGDWGLASYNAAKGAVTNLTRALAMEYGARGVRVNAVSPSLTLTEMTRPLEGNEAAMGRFAERMPIGRPAQPEEIAPAIAFLASDDAVFVTGVNLPVDGGVTASNGQPRLL